MSLKVEITSAKLVPRHDAMRGELRAEADLYDQTGALLPYRLKMTLRLEREEKPHDFLGADRRGIINQPGDVIDVDTEADFRVAEAILKERLESAQAGAVRS